MTPKELRDNILFFSALRILEHMQGQGLLSPAEAERTKSELKKRIRPTLLLI